MVWQAADIFCSFSDNIQETFGISPIEAMASSLPIVVSNWNGYKESVRDGIDGFKISTLMPEGGLGRDLAISHAMDINNYDHYVGKTSAFISVDIDQATDRFDKLMSTNIGLNPFKITELMSETQVSVGTIISFFLLFFFNSFNIESVI